MLVLNLPFKALMFLTLMRPSLVLFLVLWLKLVKDFLKVRCRLALLPFLISCLIWLDLVRSEERFSRNAETDLVCRLLLEKKKRPLLVLANTSSLVLHGTVGEADVAKLKLGLVANVTVDAVGSGTRMTGRITSLDPVATIQQGVPVYGVDVTIDLPNASVKPGMTGTANVIIASRQAVLVVPNLAIRSVSGRRYVQILKDGEAVDTDVTFGIANDTVTEVASGLAEGDLVVLPQSRVTTTPRPGGGFGGGGGPVIVGR